MKKLAIVLLLVLAGCRRQVASTTPPPVGVNTPGGISSRDAVQRFMTAAKAQDLQAFANVWGTTAGPARGNMGKDELEQRQLILFCYLKHDSYRVLSESPSPNGERVLALENKYQDLTRVANFFATRGPENRWYVRAFETDPLKDICARR